MIKKRYHSARSLLTKISLAVLAALIVCAAGTALAAPTRILSLSPASTEILFDLGLGGSVVGVTRHCDWPPEAREKPAVGDMMKVSLETILEMMPDLAVLSTLNEHLSEDMSRLGIPTVVVRQDDFEHVCASMIEVGRACGVEERARERVAALRAETEAAVESARSSLEGSPRVLAVVARDPLTSEVRRAYAAGRESFYNTVIESLGGRSALEGSGQYAALTHEGLIRVDPDMIIELAAHGEDGAGEADSLLAAWRGTSDVRAAREGRVSVIIGDFTLRAGPRWPMIVRAFALAMGGRQVITEADVAR